MHTRFLMLSILLLTGLNLNAQEHKNQKRWGIQFGYGTQQTKPFHLLDYDFEQAYVIGQLLLKKTAFKNINVDIIAEGGYYLSTHQLINKWFTTTEYFKDFPANFQYEMLQKKDIHQLAMHLGTEISVFLNPKMQLYAYAAIGPMWVSQQTERLAKGLAFSDNIGFGIKRKLSAKTWLNATVVVRHESNANLKFPNSGHNTLGIRLGAVFNLTSQQKAVKQ